MSSRLLDAAMELATIADSSAESAVNPDLALKEDEVPVPTRKGRNDGPDAPVFFAFQSDSAGADLSEIELNEIAEMTENELFEEVPLVVPVYHVSSSVPEPRIEPNNLKPLRDYKYKQWLQDVLCSEKERLDLEVKRLVYGRASMEKFKDVREEVVQLVEAEIERDEASLRRIEEDNRLMVAYGQEIDCNQKDLQLKNIKLQVAERELAEKRNEFIDKIEEYAQKRADEAAALVLTESAAAGEECEQDDDDINGDEELKQAQLDALTKEIDETKVEMMMLPSNMRGPFEKMLGEMSVRRLKIELIGLDDPMKVQQIKAEIAQFESDEIRRKMKYMDVFQKIEAEDEIYRLRDIIDPDYYDKLPEQSEKSQPVKISYDDPLGRHWEMYVRVPVELRFAQLTRNVMEYFNLDMKDEMALSDDPLGKRRLCTADACVLSETTPSNGSFQHSRDLYLHMVVDIPDDPLPDWTGVARPMMPPPHKETKAERGNRIRQKRVRMAQTKQLFWYFLFLLSYLVVVYTWVDVGNAWNMRQAVQTAVVEEDFSMSVSFFKKGFADVANSEEMYLYLNDIFLGAIGLDDGGQITDYTKIIGPIRFRQQRVQTNWTYTECLTPDKYLNWTRANQIPCCPAYDDDLRSKDPFGEPTTSRPAGRFEYSSGGFSGMSTSGHLASYKAGGYIVDFPIDPVTLPLGIAELANAEYVDLFTRVVFVEFLCYNPNYGMFQLVKLLFEYSSAGACTPSYQLLPIEMGNTIPWWVILFQLLFLMYVLYFTKVFVTELRESRQDFGSYLPFFKDGWNDLDAVTLLASYVFYILLLCYGAMPARRDFDISAAWYQDMNTVADFSQMIANINAINFLLSAIKTMKFLVMSDQFKMLSDTVINALPDVNTFMVMFVVIVMSFALSGQLLFGTSIQAYSTFGSCVNELFLVSLGDFDYQELVDVTHVFAPIWFIAFQVVVFMVMLNIFIGIINFQFSIEHSKAKSTLDSEVRNLLMRIGKGIRNLYWTKPDPNSGPCRPAFDPVSDERLRPFSKEDLKQCPRPAMRGIPRDPVRITAELNRPKYDDK